MSTNQKTGQPKDHHKARRSLAISSSLLRTHIEIIFLPFDKRKRKKKKGQKRKRDITDFGKLDKDHQWFSFCSSDIADRRKRDITDFGKLDKDHQWFSFCSSDIANISDSPWPWIDL
jgi:hypothetical protein